MEIADLLVAGGEVVTHLARRRADVVVCNGKITQLLDPGAPKPDAARVIDARGLYVLPGAIDPHTHIGGGAKVLGSVQAAVKVCTRALAFGGTTTVMEMISPLKDASLDDSVDHAQEEREGNMAIDFAFHLSLHSIDDHLLEQLARLGDAGTPSFHASFEGARGQPLDEGSLYRLLQIARERRMVAILHAEDSRLKAELDRKSVV